MSLTPNATRERATHLNPITDLSGQVPGTVTKNKTWPRFNPDIHVEDWDDMTLENNNAMLGHLLDGTFAYTGIPSISPAACRITNEDSVDQLLILWCGQILSPVLGECSGKVLADLGQAPAEVEMGFRAQCPGTSPRPDWVVLQGGIVTLIGETKCSSKWRSDKDSMPRDHMANWQWPWRQVLHYCITMRTRYAYIQTPEEIVAIRVYEAPDDTTFRWRIQRRSVPWSAHGPEELTVNLTRLSLMMMAINDRHREIRPLADMLPLNFW